MLANGIMTVYVLLSFLGRPCEEPALLLCEKRLDVVYHMTYVGVQHDCNMSSVHRGHYANNMKAARKIADAILSQEKRLGDLLPVDQLVLDENLDQEAELDGVQLTTLRRILRASNNSMIAPLFSETGILPIRYLPSCAIGSLIPHERFTDRASNPT